jgi:hypothetical protein
LLQLSLFKLFFPLLCCSNKDDEWLKNLFPPNGFEYRCSILIFDFLSCYCVMYTHIRTYTHTHIHTYTHTHIRTYAHMHIRTYAHTHIHTYTQIVLYTCMCAWITAYIMHVHIRTERDREGLREKYVIHICVSVHRHIGIYIVYIRVYIFICFRIQNTHLHTKAHSHIFLLITISILTYSSNSLTIPCKWQDLKMFILSILL